MPVDDLATERTYPSATLLLTESSRNIPASESKRLSTLNERFSSSVD